MDVGQCEQPCWNGIRPGQTTIDQVQAIFRADPALAASPGVAQFDNERCWNMASGSPFPLWRVCTVFWYAADHTISLVRLTPPQEAFQLGDAIALFGPPVASTLCWWYTRLPNMPGQVLRARVYFRDNIEVWAYSQRQPMSFLLDPTMAVYLVNYSDHRSPFRSDMPTWRGFKRYYQQLGC